MYSPESIFYLESWVALLKNGRVYPADGHYKFIIGLEGYDRMREEEALYMATGGEPYIHSESYSTRGKFFVTLLDDARTEIRLEVVDTPSGRYALTRPVAIYSKDDIVL